MSHCIALWSKNLVLVSNSGGFIGFPLWSSIQFRFINALYVLKIAQIVYSFWVEFCKCWNLLFLLFISLISLFISFVCCSVCLGERFVEIFICNCWFVPFSSNLGQLLLLIFWACIVGVFMFKMLISFSGEYLYQHMILFQPLSAFFFFFDQLENLFCPALKEQTQIYFC